MYTYLAIGYEFITEFFPFLLVLIFFRRKRGRPFTFGHYAMLTLFALYIMAVYHVTGAGTIYDENRPGQEARAFIPVRIPSRTTFLGRFAHVCPSESADPV